MATFKKLHGCANVAATYIVCGTSAVKDLHVVNGVTRAGDDAGRGRLADIVRPPVLAILDLTEESRLAFQNTPEKEENCCDANHSVLVLAK